MIASAVSVITLGTHNHAASARFYQHGFGWVPAFEDDDIVFYQLNGTVLGVWTADKLAEDAGRPHGDNPSPIALAHNLPSQEAAADLIERLVAAGGTVTRPGDAPPHGGWRGYVADPDGHAWEIAWNPDWPLDAEGNVSIPRT